MPAEIKIEINGSSAGFDKAATAAAQRLSLLSKRLAALQSVANNTTDFSKLTKSLELIRRTQAEINTISKKSNVVDSLNKLPAAAGKANIALINLSRVASDAPFGFIAIQNNIEQLATSFSGFTAKQFFSALAGPAGVGFALATVGSIMTSLIQKHGSFMLAMQALFGETTNLTIANRDLAKSFAEAEGKAAGEVAMVTSLVTIARNKNLADSTRLEAINKLNKEYDEYLPKLSLENINTQQVTDSINKLTASLIRQAKVRGVQDLIGDETKKQLELLMQAPQESLNFWDHLVAQFKSGGSIVNATVQQITLGSQKQTQALKDSAERARLFNEELNKLLLTEAEAGTLHVEHAKKAKEHHKKAKEAIDEYLPSVVRTRKELEELNRIQDVLNGNIQIKPAIDVDQIGVGFNDDFITKLAEQGAALNKENNKLLEIDERARNLSDTLSGVLAPAFNDVFQSILTGGDNALKSLTRTIAQVIARLAAAAATAAVLAAIIGAATGGASFGAGATSFMSGFKSIFSQLSGFKIPGFAEGVTNFRGGLALVGERGPELVNLPKGANVIPNHMLGAAMNVVVTGRLSGETIFLQQQRVSQRRAIFG